jgi:hypothetical protein
MHRFASGVLGSSPLINSIPKNEQNKNFSRTLVGKSQKAPRTLRNVEPAVFYTVLCQIPSSN